MECHEEVSRGSSVQPCDKPAVGMRVDPNFGTEYPVCVFHTRGEMVPLAAVVAAAKAEQRDADLAVVSKHKAEFEASIVRLEDSIADPMNTISGIEYDERKRAGQKFAVYALARAHAALSEAVGGENR